MEDGYLAEIRGFAGNFAPKNWMYCQGQQMQIQTNAALYSLLGSRFGGDDRTYFNLPDLRGRVIVGTGNSPMYGEFDLGEIGGEQSHVLSSAQLPVHSHTASVSSSSASLSGNVTAKMKVNNDESEGKSPSGKYLSVSNGPDLYAGSSTGTDTLNNDAIAVDASGLKVNVSGIAVTIANAGASTPVALMQPYLAINWIICVSGLYPTRP